jgi:type III secretion protein V
MWRKFDYFEHRLQSVLQDHMAAFLGHQETMALLVAADSSVADHMRAHSQELSALVGLLRRMLDEHTPITPFKRVLEMYVRQRARGADFLAILQTIRGLPEIRARLRGNDDSYYYFLLDDNIKEKNGQAYLALDPQLTQRILGEIRNTIDYRNTRGHVGLVVTHNYIRRFARKLVELEFPALPVLAKTELLPGLRDNVIGAIEAHQLVS